MRARVLRVDANVPAGQRAYLGVRTSRAIERVRRIGFTYLQHEQ